MFRERMNRRVNPPDLDITSFMNLMIILVPVLLINFVVYPITAMDITLPVTSESDHSNAPKGEISVPEIHILTDTISVFYPSGHLINQIPVSTVEDVFDQMELSTILQTVKDSITEKDPKFKQIIILSNDQIRYQMLVSVMDIARYYPTSEQEKNKPLFTDISLGRSN